MSHSPEFVNYETGYKAYRSGVFEMELGLVIDIEYPLDDFLYDIQSVYPTYTGGEIGDLAKHQAKYDNERELYSMWQMEAFNLNGMPATWHIVTFDTQYDPLFGEDNDKRVERAFPVMMYIPETPDNNRIWTIFGAEGVNDLIFFINKEHFKFASQCGMPSDYPEGSNDNAMYPTDWTRNHVPSMDQSGASVRGGGIANTEFSDTFALGAPIKSHIPKVGDIFVLEYDQKSVYEVKRVKEEEEMFLQKKHCWVIETTKLYVNEHINKNISGTRPTNHIDSELERIIDEPELYDDRPLPNIAKASTDVVPPTFPTTTGKGKTNPFYTPKAGEKAPNDPFGGF